ncbi:MAG: class GN sortase [Proteobacteria bacterium]|nr:class GN sortase [Pseudomonadota bacterium]MBU1057691.1 class GN sortase [Pseudomonadota bacterium]
MKEWLLRMTAFVLLVSGSLLLADGCWIRTKAVLAQYLLQRAWEQTLKSGEPTKPWPWADTWPVARLRMEGLDVDLIVLEGESGEVLAFGPGHLPRSSAPSGDGNCVLAGHRDTSFRFLQKLQTDDTFTLQTLDGDLYTYRVRGTAIGEADGLYLEEGDFPCLTLLTCYPFATLGATRTTLRYLVFADRIAG